MVVDMLVVLLVLLVLLVLVGIVVCDVYTGVLFKWF